MRRLPRVLFTLFAAASLFLCHAVCALWARSYTASDDLRWEDAQGSRSVRSAQGDVEVWLFAAGWPALPGSGSSFRYRNEQARPPINPFLFMCHNPGDTYGGWEWGGFVWQQRRNERLGRMHGYGVVPFWSVAAATALPPLAWTMMVGRALVRRYRRDDLLHPAGPA